MHTLKTKRELEIFEQGRKTAKEEALQLTDRHTDYLDFILALHNL